MRVLHLVENLEQFSEATQFRLPTRRLEAELDMRFCILEGSGRRPQCTREPGRHLECLDSNRTWGLRRCWRLRQLLQRDAPDLVHAWGLTALRTLGLAGRRWLPRTVISGAIPAVVQQLGCIDCHLLRRVRAIAVENELLAEQCREIGVHNCVVVAPGIEIGAAVTPGQQDKPIEACGRIVCVGSPPTRHGFRDAVWAMDILHYCFPEARLTIVADEDERSYPHWFARCIEIASHVEFVGRDCDLTSMLAGADACWVLTSTGAEAPQVLAAMAAGCPVIAVAQPALRDLITDAETGYLVPARDQVALSKRTFALLRNRSLGRQIGVAARRRVLERFQGQTCARRWLDVYRAAA